MAVHAIAQKEKHSEPEHNADQFETPGMDPVERVQGQHKQDYEHTQADVLAEQMTSETTKHEV